MLAHALSVDALRDHLAPRSPSPESFSFGDSFAHEPNSSRQDISPALHKTIGLLHRLLRGVLQSPLPQPLMASVVAELTPLCLALLRHGATEISAQPPCPLALTCQAEADDDFFGVRAFGASPYDESGYDEGEGWYNDHEMRDESAAVPASNHPSELALSLLVASGRLPRAIQLRQTIPIALDACASALAAASYVHSDDENSEVGAVRKLLSAPVASDSP